MTLGILALCAFLAVPSVCASQQVALGAEGDIDNTPIGGIGPALILDDGYLVLGDGGERRLILVSAQRRTVRFFGRRGQGPGEFMHLTSLFRIDATHFGLVDASVRRVTVFKVAGDSLAMVSTANTDAAGRDMCSVGSRLFLQGNALHSPVAELTYRVADGLQFTRRLGERLPPFSGDPDHPMLREFNAIGAMGCDESTQSVAWVPAQRGSVQIIDLANGRVRTILFSDFSGVVFTSISGGIRNSLPPSGFFELSERVLPMRGGWLVVGQAQYGSQRRSEWWARVVSSDSSYRAGPRRVSGFPYAPIAERGGWTACLSSPEDDITVVFGRSSSVPCAVDRMIERR